MLILALIVIFLPASLSHKTNCYTCSYSPKDASNGTRQCKDEEFEGNVVVIAECDHGCQTYVHTDSNGAFEQIRRNCAQPNSGIAFGTCKTEETQAYKTVRCLCNSDLCNFASSLRSSSFAVFLVAIIFIFRYLHYN